MTLPPGSRLGIACKVCRGQQCQVSPHCPLRSLCRFSMIFCDAVEHIVAGHVGRDGANVVHPWAGWLLRSVPFCE